MMSKIKNFYKYLFWSKEKWARDKGVNIGKHCWIATRNFGSEPYLVTIGNHVQITANVRFFTHGGGWILRKEQPDFDCFGKIVIGNNVYIGNSAMIMPGVTIGNDVIIGAGSIITKSFPDGVIIGGNPAKIIGRTEEYIKKMQSYNMGIKKLRSTAKMKFLLSDAPEEKFIKK